MRLLVIRLHVYIGNASDDVLFLTCVCVFVYNLTGFIGVNGNTSQLYPAEHETLHQVRVELFTASSARDVICLIGVFIQCTKSYCSVLTLYCSLVSKISMPNCLNGRKRVVANLVG